ncbi:hypothetical protein ASPSYDRAFT_407886 [Aspergillus sydowii CBS 593.65]|uniref:Uncharacterized protein n=1 Tax=Aspergillus sydowii CBS 593.65 TaxID=1036612 RepID=A0A1L9TA07_9EURO|nr:uncharacterized protein ASPSYDRAFT_407886 [Aspergillus sydowii CBS 593.65]OJJ56252.1 hypothetical protein ASPSYDRAFT_407886 [Aspergillus sydowii CBS 593.65]
MLIGKCSSIRADQTLLAPGCNRAILRYRLAVHTRILFPYTIMGILVNIVPVAIHATAMNIFINPAASIHGVRTKTITMARALRTNATPTRASPTIWLTVADIC